MADDMQRIKAIRDKHQANISLRSSLEGKLKSLTDQKEELEKECQSKFGIPLSEISSTIKELETLKEEKLKALEKALGII